MLAAVALWSTEVAAGAASVGAGCTKVDVDMGSGAEVSGGLPSAPQPTRTIVNAADSKKSSVGFIRTTPWVASRMDGLQIKLSEAKSHSGYPFMGA